MHELINKLDKWSNNDSNWHIDTINNHYLSTAKYKPLNVHFYIKLPVNLLNS